MPHIPKYVENLLLRRRKLTNSLMDVCNELDEYCNRLGIDASYDDACIGGHVMIYTEPSAAYRLTREAIEKALEIR